MVTSSFGNDPGDRSFKLPLLPYPQDALEPYISAKTVGFHYGKHHQTYVDNLNKLIAGSELASKTLEEIIKETSGTTDKTAIFNNAAQVWNHTFFWQSMKKNGGGVPEGRLLKLIEHSFGSFERFKASFIESAVGQFGSGWVWLVQDGNGVKILKTSNAGTPITQGEMPLITCDVWEHAYYLDYQNRRKDFVETFLNHLVNWDFAEALLR